MALDMLREEGRQDILSMLIGLTPAFEGKNIVFTIENGFTRMRLEQDIVKNAILGAMKKADGENHQIRFVDPPAPKRENDPMDDLLGLPDIIVE